MKWYCVVLHERCYGRQKQVLELEHYLDVLSRKPGVLADRGHWNSSAEPGSGSPVTMAPTIRTANESSVSLHGSKTKRRGSRIVNGHCTEGRHPVRRVRAHGTKGVSAWWAQHRPSVRERRRIESGLRRYGYACSHHQGWSNRAGPRFVVVCRELPFPNAPSHPPGERAYSKITSQFCHPFGAGLRFSNRRAIARLSINTSRIFFRSSKS